MNAFLDGRIARSGATDFAGGVRRGVKLATKEGHKLTGRGGRPTFAVAGGSRTTRVGVRVGVGGRNAVVPVTAGGAGVAVGEHRVAKLDSGATYQRGSITQHQEQAKLHRRKARKGGRAVEVGAATATLGAALHPAAKTLASMHDPKATAANAVHLHPTVAPKMTRAAMIGGTAVAAGGLGYGAFHTARANKEADAAQEARKVRNAQSGVAKSDRTRNGAAAAAVGGSATLGVGAVRQQRRAVRLAGESVHSREESQRSLGVASQRVMRHGLGAGKPGNLAANANNLRGTHRVLETAANYDKRGLAAAKDSFAAARSAKGRTAGAVLLGAGAVHLARKESQGAPRGASYR